MEAEIVITLCKLECIFPPEFFGEIVQHRWRYPVERYLLKLKSYVRNKARLEVSIAEGSYVQNCEEELQKKLEDEPEHINLELGKRLQLEVDKIMQEQFASSMTTMQQKTNRKLVHISIGLVFILCWPMFSSGHQGAILAALIPGLNIIKMLLLGLGIWKDDATVKSMSRFGDHRDNIVKAIIDDVHVQEA